MRFPHSAMNVVGSAVLVLAVACGDEPTAPSNVGSASFLIAAAANGPFNDLAHAAVVTITASDMDDIIRTLTVTDTSVEGTVTGIPAGVDRLFEVVVFDSTGTGQYSGSATANIVADSVTVVALNLTRIAGTAIIIGSIIEGADTIPTAGLVAYYPFSGNANDETTNALHGMVSGANLVADRFGTASSAYSFDGIDDEIRVASTTVLNLDAFSIQVWMRPDTGYGDSQFNGQIHVVSRWHSHGAGNSAYAATISDQGQLGLMTYNTSNEVQNWTDPGVLPEQQWSHYVGTFDGDSLRIYLDGDLISATDGADPQDSGYDLVIGRDPLGGNRFRGTLDDIRLYNRALTAPEIGALYREGTGG